MAFYSLLALTLCPLVFAATSIELPHTETLDADGKFKIAWFVDDNDVLELEAVVQTTGWLALGFSPNGGMPGSDIVMAWIDEDGTQHLSDRHATGNALPVEDAQNNLELLALSESDGVTTLRFRRHLNTCDANNEEDMAIAGTSRVIYAYHDAKPVDGVPAKHLAAHRSTRSVNIAQYEPPQVDFPEAAADVQHLDVTFEAAETPAGERTRYWWRGFRLPEALRSKKVHVIGYEALIDGEEAVAHHLLLYVCHRALNDTELAYVGANHAHNLGGLHTCNFAQPVATWAVGGEPVKLGAEYGLPLGGAETRETLLLELHLDVPDLAAHTTSAGLRLHYTEQLREHDAAIVVVGGNVDEFLVAPPGQVSDRVGYCSAACTQNGLPADGVNVVASLLHMHTLGTRMRTQHVKADGSELAPIDSNDHYDFNLQQFIWLKEPRKLERGDALITTCTYDATQRTTVTLGGESTAAEMCLHYLFVYPAPAASVCLSTGSSALVGDLLQRDAFAGNVIGADQSLTDFFEGVDDYSKLNPALKAAQDSGDALYTNICLAPSQTYLANPAELVATPTIDTPYEAPDVCAQRPAPSTTTTAAADASSSTTAGNGDASSGTAVDATATAMTTAASEGDAEGDATPEDDATPEVDDNSAASVSVVLCAATALLAAVANVL